MKFTDSKKSGSDQFKVIARSQVLEDAMMTAFMFILQKIMKLMIVIADFSL